MSAISPQEMKDMVGQNLGTSEWLLVDQEMINKFADATGDHQWIHVDIERANRESPFGGPVAHGFLTLSLLPQLSYGTTLGLEGTVMGINYGFNKVRFLNPVRPSDSIRVQASVGDVTEKESGRLLVSLNLSVEIKGQEKPALVCEWLNLFVCPPPA